MKIQKTNAMRILDSKQLSYEVLSYAHGKEAVAGFDVAKQLEENPEQVFKTLVTVANTKEYIVFVIPVAHELHLKKCAKAAGVKSVEMIHVKDINKITGYVRGGCSPIGMKKQFRTFVHESCTGHPTIMFSGGKIGVQIKMHPDELLKLIHAETADLISEA
ncbi:Cys-tRNA(Pro) deacylase [[Clostridium] innocuum]|uniref:Cys-tRNA(Pro) deacylase n=1 Tax=Clostridium innocuum TaxID=1522 RepID=UPI0021472406|nr:Cys-tRNA(Pro) deacylase [[Clostridium] innocuum]MCR0271021.1 Cys-tRNA(Pro) deacylase [[Clostridium] innocuum]